MTKINSKKKGNRNENNVAKLLKKWTGYEFARVPQSGGLGWQNRMQVTGDVIPTDPAEMVKFPFSVEAKFYKEINFEAPLLGLNSDIIDWWIQAASDAKRANKLAILFMRRNGMPKDTHYVIIDASVFDEMLAVPSFDTRNGFYEYDRDICIFLSTDLFRASYKDIRKQLKKIKWDV